MAKIAIVHVPFFSHINAATRLTAVLVRQGHEVTAWAPEPCRKRIEDAGADAPSPMSPRCRRFDGFEGWVAELAASRPRYARSRSFEELFAHDPDLIVHDSQVPWARVAGEYLGVPRIVSHPMFPDRSPRRSSGPRPSGRCPCRHPEEAKERFEASWLSIARRWGVELGDWGAVIHSAWASETTFTYTTEEILGDIELPRLALHRPAHGSARHRARRGRPTVRLCVLRDLVQCPRRSCSGR